VRRSTALVDKPPVAHDVRRSTALVDEPPVAHDATRTTGQMESGPTEMTGESMSLKTAEAEVLITRVFDAPRALVFKAWTEKSQLLKWYAPPGCSISFSKIDVRPGGEFLSCIRIPDGKECWCKGVYREVVANERLVYSMGISNAKGETLTAAQAGMAPAWPEETWLTVTFAEIGGKTQVTLRQTVSEVLAKKTGAYPSWLLMLDRLAGTLVTQ
jgi:uncharacterized protein YndB with AHSA1/START domain